MLRLDIYFGNVLWCLWHGYLEKYVIYPLRCFEKIFMQVSFENYWRHDVYFLNNCNIRVFYRFNRSRVLQWVCLILALEIPRLFALESYFTALIRVSVFYRYFHVLLRLSLSLLRFETYILVMYYDTWWRFYYLLMRCYDIIPLRVLKNYLYMFWTYWRCNI
jgi:hypothetical protein